MRLLAHQRLKDARTVMLYYSLPDEVYTHTLVDALLASGKRVLLPRVTGEGTMELRCYTGPQSLEQGAYNIMDDQAWTAYINLNDPTIEKALSVFKNNEAFPKKPSIKK